MPTSVARLTLSLRARGLPPQIHSNYGFGFFLFVMAQFIHGLFQSTGGPVNTSIMGNWFPKKGRGLIFGLWTCHQYIGDIVAALATAAIINAGFHWQRAPHAPKGGPAPRARLAVGQGR